MQQVVTTITHKLLAVDGDFFKFQGAEPKQEGWEMLSSPEWLEGWKSYIVEKVNGEGWSHEVVRADVLGLLVNKFDGAREFMRVVRLSHFHWQTRDHQQATYHQIKENPEPNTLYIHMDFQETTTLPLLNESPAHLWYAQSRQGVRC